MNLIPLFCSLFLLNRLIFIKLSSHFPGVYAYLFCMTEVDE